MTTRDTIERSHGRWREILPALGMPSAITTGKHIACPMCGGTDRFRFTDRTKAGDYFCSMCGAGKGMQLLMRFHGWDFKRTADEVDRIIGNLPPPSVEFSTMPAANPGACRRVYGASQPVEEGDPVARYLRSRGLTGAFSKALRYSPELRHKPSGTVQRGMLAVFCDEDGKPATIHRTFLTEAGRKASVDPVRMFMPGTVPNGGAIRLATAAGEMGVAEGIETALAASQMYGMPVWATTSSTLLEQWKPPLIARHITIFADNDLNFVGQCSAYTLAKQLVLEARRDKIERSVRVWVPDNPDSDWNDLIEKKMEMA